MDFSCTEIPGSVEFEFPFQCAEGLFDFIASLGYEFVPYFSFSIMFLSLYALLFLTCALVRHSRGINFNNIK